MTKDEKIQLVQVIPSVLSGLASTAYAQWCTTHVYSKTDILCNEELSGLFCDGYEQGFHAAITHMSQME